jgi:hypothetical protein
MLGTILFASSLFKTGSLMFMLTSHDSLKGMRNMLKMNASVKRLEDVRDLFNFYSENHVLGRDQNLARWMFQLETGFSVAELRKDDSLVAMFAYIRSDGRFRDSRSDLTIFGAGWAASADAPGSGAILLKQVLKSLDADFIAVGLSDASKAIYSQMKMEMGKLRNFHFFDSVQSAREWGCWHQQTSTAHGPSGHIFEEVAEQLGRDSTVLDSVISRYPSRSIDYLRQRFLSHPEFGYKTQMITNDGNPICIAAFRLVDTPKGNILRLVDLLIWPGVEAAQLNLVFEELLRRSMAAVLDYRLSGQDVQLLSKVLFPDDCEAIIPHLVSPIKWENTTLDFVCTRQFEHLSRADGDQDRPN